MHKVYVVQEPRKFNGESVGSSIDISSAGDYGEFVYLFSGGLAPNDMNTVVVHLMRALRDFGPDDYLLPIGAPSLIMMAGIIASNRSGGMIKILEWSRRDSCYRVRRVDMAEAKLQYEIAVTGKDVR